MKRFLVGMIVISILFGCIHDTAYASDFVSAEVSTDSQEISSGETVEIVDEDPAKASTPDGEGGEESGEGSESGSGAESGSESESGSGSGEGSSGDDQGLGEEPTPTGGNTSEGGEGSSESGTPSEGDNTGSGNTDVDNPGEGEQVPVIGNTGNSGNEGGSTEGGNTEGGEQASGLRIISQSEDVYALIGETATFYVETTATRAKYMWYVSKDNGQTWERCTYNGYKTGHLSFEVKSYHLGYKFKCHVTDKDVSEDEEVVSNIFSLYDKTTVILEQSSQINADLGNKITFSVYAEGNKLSYRWYFSKDNGNKWSKVQNYTVYDADGNKASVPYEGYSTNCLSFNVTSEHYGYVFKCVITDRTNNVIDSNIMSVLPNASYVSEQPKDEYHLIGETTYFHVETQERAASYKWYYSKDGGNSWYQCTYSGYKTATLAFTVQAYHYGYKFRCEVVDGAGNKITTEECTLYEKETVVNTPSVLVEVEKWATANLLVEAEGNKLSYRWYCSKDEGQTWSKCGNYYDLAEDGIRTLKKYEGVATNNLSFIAQDDHTKTLFRCTVTDRSGKQYYSEVIAVKIKAPDFVFAEQPKDFYGLLNEEAVIGVKAQGGSGSLAFRWYISKDGGNTWGRCGYNGFKSSTLKFPIQLYQYGYQFYCEVEDKLGRTIVSDIVTLYEKETEIISEPEDVLSDFGTEVELAVEAVGNKLTYKWYRSSDEGTTWEICPADIYKGVQTNKLSFVVSEEAAKYVYRIEITDRKLVKTYSRAIAVQGKEMDKALRFTDFDLESNATLNGLDVIVDAEYIRSNAVITENGNRVSLTLTPQNAVSGYDTFLVHFFAKSDVKNSDITIKINNSRYVGNFSIPTYTAEFILPVKGISRLDKLVLDAVVDGQKIALSNFEVLSTNGKSLSQINVGIFDRDPGYQKVLVDESTAIGYHAAYLMSDEKYLYAIGKGELLIYEINGNSPSVVGALYGVGNAREMAFCNNGEAVIVSSRENGVFIVDTSDKTAPHIVSEIASEGLSTGICVAGKYCFIASRKYGIEIYDISDITSPKYVTLVYGNCEEYYDCSVSGKYLYVSSWAEKKITVFDIENIANPVKVKEVATGGNAAGSVIRDSYLYLATGYHSKDSASNFASPGYGMGNGLEIYDISTPSSPRKVSVTKIDGRYFYSGFDHWNVKISGNYAFYTNSYSGMHVIDISNPYAPVKLFNLEVDIPQGSKNYKAISSDTYAFPYDTTQYTRAIITSVAIVNGGIYYSTNSGDTYFSGKTANLLGMYYLPIAGLYNDISDQEGYDHYLEDKTTDDVTYTVGNFEIRETAKGEDIWSVCEYNGKYYCATGKREILVLDADYNVIERYATDGITKDAIVVKGVLYVAESNSGLGAYQIEDANLTKIGSVGFDAYTGVFTTVNAVDDNYLVTQISWTRYAIIDITNPANPKMLENSNVGTMYDRSLLGQTGKSDFQSIFSRTYMIWYQVNPAGRPKIIKKLTSPKYSEQNGVAYGNGKAVTVTNNGYIYYDPQTIIQSEYDALPIIKVDGVKLRGMPNIRDNMMVVTNCFGREITIVDIGDIDKPVLLANFTVNGNPDEVYSEEEGKYIIPLRHGGLMEIKIK